MHWGVATVPALIVKRYSKDRIVIGTLDKEVTSHDDLLDAFRLSVQFWH